MRRSCFLPWCLLMAVLANGLDFRAARAQDPDTLAVPQWDVHLTGRLSGSQAGYRNWVEGGLSSLASTAALTGNAERTSSSWFQSYDLRLAFGIVKQDTFAVRKADDVVRLRSSVVYRGDGIFQAFRPTVASSMRTQFAPGFSYDRNPFPDDRDPPVKVSDTFSPATFTQSLGLTYETNWGFQQRFGIGAKETVVLIERFRPLYGHADEEAVRFQVGVETFSDFEREIFTNVRLKSTLGLFAAFNQENLPDMLWENHVVMQVNRWLSADVEVVILFDRDISERLQLKEVLSIGISVVII